MPILNSVSSHETGDERLAHEPSMEEILASIRRIISDDQSLATHREHGPETRTAVISPLQPAAAIASQSPHDEAVIDSADGFHEPDDHAAVHHSEPERRYMEQPFQMPAQVAPFERKPADFADMRLRKALGEDDAPAVRQPAEPVQLQPHVSPSKPPVPLPAPQDEDRPVSEDRLVSPATDAAVSSSFSALFASRLLPSQEMVAEMTRELLRPMLKAWLDDNLPVMVERLVRAEIERVARGGR